MQITPKEFVETWQQAESLDEVAIKIGTKKQSATTRAIRMRQKGVPLKCFRATPAKADYATLAKLAKKLA